MKVFVSLAVCVFFNIAAATSASSIVAVASAVLICRSASFNHAVAAVIAIIVMPHDSL